jgi:hypothetical protein
MKLIQLFILIIAFFMLGPARAGVLIEPLVGYNLGKFEINVPNSEEEKFNGASYGGRLGYQQLGFQLGLDYLHSSVSVDDNDYKENLSVSEFAAFVGFEFPALIRVYAGYIFSAMGEAQADFGTGSGKETLKFSDGTGLKAGIGFTALPFLDINFEYRKGTFGSYKQGSTAKQDLDTDYNAFMVGISLPFVI